MSKTKSGATVNVPNHLIDLFDRTATDMTVEQQKEIARLFVTIQVSFRSQMVILNKQVQLSIRYQLGPVNI